MTNVKYEYSRNLPEAVENTKFQDGEPILYAYECVLLERETAGERFIYTAVNLKTGGKEIISRRKTPLLTSEVEQTVEQIRLSKIAGASRFQADRSDKNRLGLKKAREILTAVFRFILPNKGFALRKEQIVFANRVLDTIERQEVTLAEAETGTGKTEGYIIPAVIAKRGRLNDEYNANLYKDTQYADRAKLPIVIATSSIALQRAILTEYIPRLSQILLDGGVIKEPLSAILRKGKEHYLCERNLRAHLLSERNPETKRVLERLLLPTSSIDLAEADITKHVKEKISVSGRCSDICPHRRTCRYFAFREETLSTKIDIQVCNHNYLLADSLLRADGQAPLIPNYGCLIIDESHKYAEAARVMYGTELSSDAAPEIFNNIERLTFKRAGLLNPAAQAAKKLSSESGRLFNGLTAADGNEPIADGFNRAKSGNDNGGTADKKDGGHTDKKTPEKTAQKGINIDLSAARHIRNIRDIAERLLFILRGEAFYRKADELLKWVGSGQKMLKPL